MSGAFEVDIYPHKVDSAVSFAFSNGWSATLLFRQEYVVAGVFRWRLSLVSSANLKSNPCGTVEEQDADADKAAAFLAEVASRGRPA